MKANNKHNTMILVLLGRFSVFKILRITHKLQHNAFLSKSHILYKKYQMIITE